MVYIINSRNFKIDAAANYFIIVDSSSSFVEVSTNNNVTVSYNNITDIINSAPVQAGFYLLGQNLTINSIPFLKGSLITFDGLNGKLVYLYYNCPVIFYLTVKNSCYIKSGSLNWSPVTTYNIVLDGF